MKITTVIIRSGVVMLFLLTAPLSHATPAAMSVAYSSLVSATTMTAYCQAPPLKQALSPNIMFAIDVSGSMDYPAYYPNGSTAAQISAAYGTGSKTYEGYFDPSKNYALLYSDGTNTSWIYSAGTTTLYYEEELVTGATCTKISCDWSTTACKNTNSGGCIAKGAAGYPSSVCTSNFACCTSWNTSGDCGNPKSGNRLNFENMKRIDVLRWAMTGGTPAYSPVPAPPTTTLCAGAQNDGTYCNPMQYAAQPTRVGRDCSPAKGCVLSWLPSATTNEYKYKVRVPWDRVMSGLAFQMQNLPVIPRMGAMFYSGTQVENQGLTYLGDFTTAGVKTTFMYDNIIASINNNSPNGNTPTGPAMWDIYNYYSQKSRRYNGLVPQTTTDTWRNPMYNCKDTTGANCTYIPCVDNFAILMSDGEWNRPTDNISTSATGPIVITDSDPVVPAYVMHRDFLNTKTSVTTRVRDVYTIALFQATAAGTPSGSLALKNVAMYGAFPTSTTWPEGTTGFPQLACGGSSGSLCVSIPTSTSTPASACKASWDADCDGLPDTFASGDSADEIKTSIYAAVLEILSHTTAGTAASVLASREGSGANLMQAVYYPKKSFVNATVDWVGNLQNLWYYIDPKLANSQIREEGHTSSGVHDNILNLKTGATSQNDYITQFFYDSGTQSAMASRWTDTTGDASITGETALTPIKVDAVSNIWEAGELLWARNWLTRKIYTFDVKGNYPSTNLMDFKCTAAGTCPNRSDLQVYLNAATVDQASTIMEWVIGNDNPVSGAYAPSYRLRSAQSGSATHIWKLGDIINSTPKISSWQQLGDYNLVYKDPTYGPVDTLVYQSIPVNANAYITGYQYKGRGMVYTGGNDGMLHAFRLGLLQSKWTGQVADQKARLLNKVCSTTTSILCSDNTGCPGSETCTGTPATLGEEAWAFIPRNVLPYLKYLADPNYCHLYTVDLTPLIFDASINAAAGCTNYYDCTKDVSSWRTVLIGGMRFGGACNKPNTVCTDCISTPVSDPTNTAKGLGYSSYFALDITDQDNPKLMWEYDGTETGTYNNKLGFSYSGPAVLRVSNFAVGGVTGAAQHNGKWLVVFGSGPTGPIDSLRQQFMGMSNQNLTLHVFDLVTGPGTNNDQVKIIDTGIANAFSGSITVTTYDVDLDYSDDVVYVPYTSATTTSASGSNGGILRLLTNQSIDPAAWTWSNVITGTGPITSAPVMLTDDETKDIWLLFGSGRYFFDTASSVDEANPPRGRQIFGMKERCLNANKTGFDPSCADVALFTCLTPTAAVTCGGLTNVDNILDANDLEARRASATDPNYKGWYIDLDPAFPTGSPPVHGERVITNPSIDATGIAFFTTFKPQNNACQKDGQTNIWAVKFDTGGAATGKIKGTAIIQVSTGSIEQVDLATAFSQRDNRRTVGMTGQPPTREGLTVIAGSPGVSKPLFMKER